MADDPAPQGGEPQIPHDPFSVLAAMAAQVHEMFVSYRDAGFSVSQALYLCASVVTGGPKAPPE